MPLPEKRIDAADWFDSDSHFDQLYPFAIQTLARRHWTPLYVARLAARFLAEDTAAKILDIGSGSGKFCLAAVYYHPRAFFYGVQQRKSLMHHPENAKEVLGFRKVTY